MTLLAPRRKHFGTARRRGGTRCAWLFAALSIVAATSSQAQVQIGGNRPPSVTVDQSVLDRLGPPQTLPQLFGAAPASGSYVAPPETTASRPTAKESASSSRPRAKTTSAKHRTTHRVARRAAPEKNSSTARAKTPSPVASKAGSAIHLVPPGAAPAAVPQVASDQNIVTKSVRPAAGISPPPETPMPPLPQAAPAPPPPALPPTPAHEEAPTPPAHLPSDQTASAAPASLAAAPPPVPAATPASPPAPAPAAPPPVAAAPSPPPAPVKVASAASQPASVQVATTAAAGNAMNTIKFSAGSTDLPANSAAVLDPVATKLLANDALRVQLIAHATGGDDQAMEARRVSLARAIAVRAYLIDKGVRSLRMDVRALGNRSDDGPATDQVDLLIVSQ